MTISRKPKNTAASEAEIKAVIKKGGSVVNDNQGSERKNLQLRLETSLIEQIDELRGKRMVPPSRHTWILEAIHEKLQNL
jgi:hypothetical protein